MVIGVIYEFLMVWPFYSKEKKAKVSDASLNFLTSFIRVCATKIDSVKPVNQKKKVPDV